MLLADQGPGNDGASYNHQKKFQPFHLYSYHLKTNPANHRRALELLLTCFAMFFSVHLRLFIV